MKTKAPSLHLFITVLLFVAGMFSGVYGQGTAFTYQGRLNQGNGPANGAYDFRFRAATDVAGNNYVGPTILTNGEPVANGLFTVTLDFGGVFNGMNIFLEVSVRTNGAVSYTTLSPLQPATPAPYAITASNLTGNLPSAQLTGAIPSAQLAGTYSGAVAFNNPANSFSGNGGGLTNVNAVTLGGLASSNYWQLSGNTVASGQFIGSLNAQPVDVFAGGQRAFRLEPRVTNGSPNVIGGSLVNFVSPDVHGAVIGGGGTTNEFNSALSNSIINASSFGMIGGGEGNTIRGGTTAATIGGGGGNIIDSISSQTVQTIAGGAQNKIYNAGGATIGGGFANTITNFSGYAVIAGGDGNLIGTNTDDVVISGGAFNWVQDNALGATISGGINNTNSGNYAVIPGGANNFAAGNYSFAAGQLSVAAHSHSFVWSDGNGGAPFSTTKTNQFLIHATNGVGIGTASPQAQLHVAVGSSTGVTANPNSFAVFEKSTNGYMSLLAPSSSETGFIFGIGNANTDGAIIYNNVNARSGFQIRTGTNQTHMTITSAGNVGLGFAFAPTRELEVQNVGDTEIGIQSADANGHMWTLQSSAVTGSTNLDASFQISDRTLGQTRFYIGTNGNVGIGNRNPQSALDVTGTITATGFTASGIVTGASFQGSGFVTEIYANGERGLRIEGTSDPNIIGGSPFNSISSAIGATIAGGGTIGVPNTIYKSDYAAIGGGRENYISNSFTATIAGGSSSTISNSNFAAIGGGIDNVILNNSGSTIAGGFVNQIGGANVSFLTSAGVNEDNTIGGGDGNFIATNAGACVIAGGDNNVISNLAISVIGGMIPGGRGNAVGGSFGFAAGLRAKSLHNGTFVWGDSTQADIASTGQNQFLIRASGGVGIGTNAPQAALHVVTSSAGTPAPNANSIAVFEKNGTGYISVLGPAANENGIVFGNTNTTTDAGIIYNNAAARSGLLFRTGTNQTQMAITALGNVGIGTTVPSRELEVQNSGDTEIGIKSTDSGGHLWTLQSSSLTGSVNLDASFQIIDRTSGGARLFIGTNGNVGIGTSGPTNKLHVNGGITCTALTQTSDRNAKENFKAVSGREVLEKVAKLPISRWNFKELKDGEHMGPMAQDFYAAFGLGGSDKTITAVDPDGVALAAIQGLNQKLEQEVKEKDTRIGELEKRLAALEAMVHN